MAEFMVQAADLNQKAGELRALKERLNSKCSEYSEKGNALSSSFEGDTANLFIKEVSEYVAKMTEFINVVERYCVTMEQTAARYTRADSESAEIVRFRGY